MKILLLTVLMTFHVHAAKWTPEVPVSETTLQSTDLALISVAFSEMTERHNIMYDVDIEARVGRMLSKKESEPLRNSIKQFYHIKASRFYCNTSVEADEVLSDKDLESMSYLVRRLHLPLEYVDISYDDKAKDDFVVELYALANQDHLELVVGSITCNDASYADQSILSIFDTNTNELLNLTILVSE